MKRDTKNRVRNTLHLPKPQSTYTKLKIRYLYQNRMFLGLGCHGLTTDASGLTHLHAALKVELQHHIDAYKSALHRLDELGLVTNDTKKPIDASHQRLLSLNYDEVQQRLIDNTTLLTMLDKPVLKQLRPCIDTLGSRVQSDKEVLFCVSQLKR